MYDASHSTADLPFAEAAGRAWGRGRSWLVRLGLLGGLAAAVGTIAVVAILAAREKSAAQDAAELIAFKGLNASVQQGLDPRYRDADGNLIADPPGEERGLLDPETLVLAHYLGDDDGKLRVDWETLGAQLTQATGKPVRLQAYLHTPDEIGAVADGAIHLVAAHSAEVPCLVNCAGLVPFAELGSLAGTDGNCLIVAAAAKGQVDSLADLRGKVLVCTEPDSITGYRAAVVAIALETGMRPNADYGIYYSHKQERSIRGLTIGKFQFVALSKDVLQRMLREGSVEQSQFKTIYRSQTIPRLTIGYTHRLRPQLAATITSTVMDFNKDDGDLEQEKQAFHFVGIDYKRDYEFVRRLDDAFDPRFSQIFSAGYQD